MNKIITDNKLHLPDDTKKALGDYFDNPEFFKVFENVPPMDDDEIHRLANKVRKHQQKMEDEETVLRSDKISIKVQRYINKIYKENKPLLDELNEEIDEPQNINRSKTEKLAKQIEDTLEIILLCKEKNKIISNEEYQKIKEDKAK